MERYLLDTMAVLWMGFLPENLPKRASKILSDPETDLSYSMVSLWEIGLKLGSGGYREFELPGDWDVQIPRRLEEQGFARIEVVPKDCRRIQNLPFHHRDPFDRMLIAQAINGNFTVIGSDKIFDDYGVKRVW
jgi:PIN domain nuclease of toxin-antitoxin system